MLHTETFKRGKGKLAFYDFYETPEIIDHGEEYPFILTTNRNLVHYNCGTMTRRTANIDIVSEDYLMINPVDASVKNINNDDWITVSSARGKIELKVKITDEVKPGILSTTFHFPETLTNKLTSDVFDQEALCPEYKVVAVDLVVKQKTS